MLDALLLVMQNGSHSVSVELGHMQVPKSRAGHPKCQAPTPGEEFSA
jgi:hypothetical protein